MIGFDRVSKGAESIIYLLHLKTFPSITRIRVESDKDQNLGVHAFFILKGARHDKTERR